MSPAPDHTLINPPRTIAELERELAQLRAERDEALAREAATAEVLQVINSSRGDLAPVFDAILEKAMVLCGAAFGTMGVTEGNALRTIATRGLPAAFVEFGRRNIHPGGPNSIVGRLFGGEAIVHLLDAKDDEIYRKGDPNRRAMVDLGGARSVLCVALQREANLLGAIAVYRQEVRPFTDKQIALLQNFAAQAAIAMENARLLTETREALEQQTATAELLQVINSSPGDLTPVFDAMLEKAMRLCGAAFGGLFTYDGSAFPCVALRGLPPELVEFFHTPYPASGPRAGEVVRIVAGEDVLQIEDLTGTDAYRAGRTGRRLLADTGGARTMLWIALRKEGALLGVLVVYRNEVKRFSEIDIALLRSFGAQAVIAMENARLINETREALEQQTATSELLQVINSSPGDLTPVFDALLDKAMRLCEAAFGILMTYDGEFFHTVASHGVPPAYADFLRAPTRPHPQNGLGVVLSGERLFHVADIRESEAYRVGDPLRVATVDLGGARTHLGVPLRKDGAVLGVIVAYRQEIRPFTDKQIALLENFAAQAVIAIENARLLGELRQRTEEVAELNRGLEARVAEQVEELGRVGRLKRFLAPQLAELIVSQGDEKILESHRREIVVVFCDLRGYTAFTETAEPEEVLDLLREYHGALGPLVSRFEGTLDQFSGDGIMVFFNDPVPIPDPAERAINMAVAMREAAGGMIAAWRRRDRELGFGAGIAQGYATLGQIGFAERSGYTAIGTVCNLAARLCAEAKDGQILISGRVAAAVAAAVVLEDLGSLALKGLSQPVSAYNVPLAAPRPDLRVIEGGPQSV
jgi:class 3 adenylate cyclase/prephenate dehydratase